MEYYLNHTWNLSAHKTIQHISLFATPRNNVYNHQSAANLKILSQENKAHSFSSSYTLESTGSNAYGQSNRPIIHSEAAALDLIHWYSLQNEDMNTVVFHCFKLFTKSSFHCENNSSMIYVTSSIEYLW